jgi:hypothetical protein
VDARRTTTYRLAIIVAAAAIELAACGGSNSPHVADLGHHSGDPVTAPATGDPTRLLDEWAACMREHGDPAQTDPTIDANKVIHIAISPSVRGGYNGYSGEYGSGGPGLSCRTYLTAAQKDLQGNETPQSPSTAQLDKFAACMRANGLPDFPDPSNGGLRISIHPGSDLNPSNPVFQSASKVCAVKIGIKGFGQPQPGTIKLDGTSLTNG